MPEPLSHALLADVIEKLNVAFPRNLGKQNPAMMAEVYRNGLRGLGGDAVRYAVDRLIQTEQYFPKVAQIREVAHQWQRQHVVEVQRDRADPSRCHICGARETERPIYRNTGKKDEAGEEIREYLGQRVVLEHDRRAHHVYDNSEQSFA